MLSTLSVLLLSTVGLIGDDAPATVRPTAPTPIISAPAIAPQKAQADLPVIEDEARPTAVIGPVPVGGELPAIEYRSSLPTPNLVRTSAKLKAAAPVPVAQEEPVALAVPRVAAAPQPARVYASPAVAASPCANGNCPLPQSSLGGAPVQYVTSPYSFQSTPQPYYIQSAPSFGGYTTGFSSMGASPCANGSCPTPSSGGFGQRSFFGGLFRR